MADPLFVLGTQLPWVNSYCQEKKRGVAHGMSMSCERCHSHNSGEMLSRAAGTLGREVLEQRLQSDVYSYCCSWQYTAVSMSNGY